MLDAVVRAEGEPDLVQLSGGEPTIHPQFWEIVAAARARPIRHIMVNTNGVRIAQEEGFAEKLKAVGIGFEVYLQFDSLSDDALMELRGARLNRIRRQALERLEAAGVSTTLVCAVRKGVNDEECAAIVDYALQMEMRARRRLPAGPGRRAQRGVRRRAPPLDAVGPPPPDRRGRRVRGVGPGALALQPGPDLHRLRHPRRPSVVPVTRLMKREDIVAAAPNTISFERDPALKARIFDLLSLSTVEDNGEIAARQPVLLPARDRDAGEPRLRRHVQGRDHPVPRPLQFRPRHGEALAASTSRRPTGG